MAAAAAPMIETTQSARRGAFTLDRALLNDLADMALTAAKRGGASYADIRIGETLREFAFAKDDRLENYDERSAQGFGMRVLLDGCWGFYGARRLDPQSLRDGVERALDNARAVKPIQAQPIALERLPAHEAEWIMPMGVDPFDDPRAREGGPAALHRRQRARSRRGFLLGVAVERARGAILRQ